MNPIDNVTSALLALYATVRRHGDPTYAVWVRDVTRALEGSDQLELRAAADPRYLPECQRRKEAA